MSCAQRCAYLQEAGVEVESRVGIRGALTRAVIGIWE